MEIMELGAVGKLVGTIAMVASLIHVRVQMRQNSALTVWDTTPPHGRPDALAYRRAKPHTHFIRRSKTSCPAAARPCRPSKKHAVPP